MVFFSPRLRGRFAFGSGLSLRMTNAVRQMGVRTPSYDLFATSRLLCTVKAPNTWPARRPAICLSIALPTTP
jgi:hypothetical protein